MRNCKIKNWRIGKTFKRKKSIALHYAQLCQSKREDTIISVRDEINIDQIDIKWIINIKNYVLIFAIMEEIDQFFKKTQTTGTQGKNVGVWVDLHIKEIDS